MNIDRLFPRIDWPSITLQVGLILLGLLLAFSVDRGWDGYQKRQVENDYKEALRADFSANVSALDSAIMSERRILAGGRAILGAIADRRMIARDSVVAANIPKIFDFALVSLNTATYDDLKAAGALAELRDHELRRALANFDALLNGELAHADRIDFDGWLGLTYPYLNGRISSDVYYTTRLRSEIGVPVRQAAKPIHDVLDDEAFWNLVALRLQVETARLRLMETLRGFAVDVVHRTVID
jgi:hypothetical protein